MTAKQNGPAPVAAVVAITAQVVDQRLRVDALVREEDGRRMPVRIPDRELAALLPRSILAADGHPAPQLLDAIRTIMARTVVGRRVRVWEYRGQRYLAFLSWRTVRFSAEQAGGARSPSRNRPAVR